ncbi:FAD assembly factor SdhE [Aquicella lusitana]|uniref:FAD assembly factor SdhE n=1 Tax=Aquicella lusitana TaxID=254246 RepID=A0A370GG98_9COXI|nr:succinate dehydrogenase assembly factor 2 [Aquicella lusitana]RDI42691.1 antitoxin CptB [Aquicella lusitana]VVC73454.1 Antitoxin CptB [Aquicella lusitana]
MKLDNEHNILENFSRLKWACRRGMLELDVLLGNFLEEAYPDLSLADKQRFIALLGQSDQDLYKWLLGREQPADKELVNITEAIRRHARSRI